MIRRCKQATRLSFTVVGFTALLWGCDNGSAQRNGDGAVDPDAAISTDGQVDSRTPDASPSTPGLITDLRVVSPHAQRLTLRWTAPTMEGGGSAAAYEIYYATRRLRPWMLEEADVIRLASVPTPASAGSAEELVVEGLAPNATYFFAIRSQGGDSIWSVLSALAPGVTLPVLSGGEIFVSLAGDDGNDATREHPLRTIAAACQASASGDVIRVLAGVYLQDRCSAHPNTALVSEDGPRQAVIDGEGQVQHLIAIWGDNDVVVDGFELRNTGGGSDGNDVIWIDGNGQGEWAENIQLRRLYVHDAGEEGDCIKVTNYVDGFTLELSELHSAWAPAQGEVEELLDLKLTRNAVIRYNWFHHLPGSHEGAMAYSKTDCENIVFENNIFGPQSDQAGDSALGGGWSSSTVGYNTVGLYIRNNLFIENHYSAVGAYGAQNEYVVNNVFFNCGRSNAGILRVQEGGAQTDSDHLYFVNNLIIDSAGLMPERVIYKQSLSDLTSFFHHDNLYWNAGQPIPAGGYVDPNLADGFLNLDPALRDPGVLDPAAGFDALIDRFWPADNQSPVIDSGFGVQAYPEAGVTTDILGSPRPAGSGYDRGMLEGCAGYLE